MTAVAAVVETEATLVYQPVRIQGLPPRFLVACSECRGGFPVAGRTLNEYRKRKRVPVCPDCRRSVTPARYIRVTPALLQFWLDRFTMEEIRQMGASLDEIAGRLGIEKAKAA